MAERAQRAVQCDAAVEIGAGDVDAVVRKNVVTPLGPGAPCGADADQ